MSQASKTIDVYLERMRLRGLAWKTPALCYALAATTVFTGCCGKARAAKDDVAGRCVANHGKGLDVIELRPGGTYSYIFRSIDVKERRNKGHWKFYFEGAVPRITFDDFVFGLRGYGGMPGFGDVEVKQFWGGTLSLCLDPDLAYFYVKQKQ
jgi:hypothetical protein